MVGQVGLRNDPACREERRGKSLAKGGVVVVEVCCVQFSGVKATPENVQRVAITIDVESASAPLPFSCTTPWPCRKATLCGLCKLHS